MQILKVYVKTTQTLSFKGWYYQYWWSLCLMLQRWTL